MKDGAGFKLPATRLYGVIAEQSGSNTKVKYFNEAGIFLPATTIAGTTDVEKVDAKKIPGIIAKEQAGLERLRQEAGASKAKEKPKEGED